MKKHLLILLLTVMSVMANSQTLSIEALGGEKGSFISHAYNKVWLQKGIQGNGERFEVEYLQNGNVAIKCLVQGGNKYLSHAHGRTQIQNGHKGLGEEWIMHTNYDGQISFEAMGGEKGKYLSHAHSIISLKSNIGGEGELWRISNSTNQHNTMNYRTTNNVSHHTCCCHNR